ncbi:MAG: CPXCG motif-containing cysteine-rich protein [Verrucomicrobiota bacterium]
MTELGTVICPTCFESFALPLPGWEEVPCEVDYDCEVCCRPMIVRFFLDGDETAAEAIGLEEM